MLKQYEIKLTHAWHHSKPSLCLLRPFSLAYRAITSLRRTWYRVTVTRPLPVPVIVVGNISVGGSGKTPVVIALVQALKKMGYHPGVISRGYKSSLNQTPTLVENFHSCEQVGDEPLLIHFKTQVPVVIAKRRRQAALHLLKTNPQINVIISDDGLQHYALPRTLEIAMLNPQAWGNRQVLPEGPLREPLSRLKQVDYLLSETPGTIAHEIAFEQTQAIHLSRGEVVQGLERFQGTTVHAVAGIAHPNRFFNGLRAKGIHVIEHPFPDHHHFQRSDLAFDTAYPILMTEKDAMKCQGFTDLPIWVVNYEAKLDKQFLHQLVEDIRHG